jgi:hypothetical protein
MSSRQSYSLQYLTPCFVAVSGSNIPLISTTISVAPLRQVVDAAPGKNNFGVIPQFFGLVGEIVGIDPDAPPACMLPA